MKEIAIIGGSHEGKVLTALSDTGINFVVVDDGKEFPYKAPPLPMIEEVRLASIDKNSSFRLSRHHNKKQRSNTKGKRIAQRKARKINRRK